ncbi:hypothetical protein FFLO_01139 [Filobasidium floriforme]|uniref:Uncharacterized protein n=1 Tax=Filobasidium floriforme TaxID=5210 RepID=A0A8K0NSY9_9TREE|nr:uncharacterized protein HD553DRAFT_320814 [Filobasidium floriforme]KAG7570941.1 hypothetical protein FFLO_01139 [Filobasidium floriforme]KAH8077469.1 hypothetical protein HD553DRAFT_320814 [Filobasidium floriforme]
MVNHSGKHDRDVILASKMRVRVGLGMITRHEALKFFLRLERQHFVHREGFHGLVVHHLDLREGFAGPIDDLEALDVISSPLFEGVGALDVHEVGSYLFEREDPNVFVDGIAVLFRMGLDKQDGIQTFGRNVFFQSVQKGAQVLRIIGRLAILLTFPHEGGDGFEIVFNSRHFGQVVLVVGGEGKDKGRGRNALRRCLESRLAGNPLLVPALSAILICSLRTPRS